MEILFDFFLSLRFNDENNDFNETICIFSSLSTSETLDTEMRTEKCDEWTRLIFVVVKSHFKLMFVYIWVLHKWRFSNASSDHIFFSFLLFLNVFFLTWSVSQTTEHYLKSIATWKRLLLSKSDKKIEIDVIVSLRQAIIMILRITSRIRIHFFFSLQQTHCLVLWTHQSDFILIFKWNWNENTEVVRSSTHNYRKSRHFAGFDIMDKWWILSHHRNAFSFQSVCFV